MTLAQTFHAVLVGGSEAIVRLAAQPDEPVAAPLHFEQTGRSLVVRFTHDAARVGARLQVTDESTAHVVGLVVGVLLRLKPLG